MTALALVAGLVALTLAGVVVRLARDRAALLAAVRDAAGRVAVEPGPHDGTVAAEVAALHRALEEREARSRADEWMLGQLELALDAIAPGVVIVDRAGTPVFTNGVAAGFVTARHGEALVGVAVEELLTEACRGIHGSRTVDLFGPPRRTLVVTAMPLFGPDDLVGALAVVDDVTEHRRVDAVRRDFVANISHELKTPIGAISLLAETVLAEDDPAIVRRLAHRLVAEADRVNRTVEDLLVLSRIEHEEAPSHEPVPVHLVVAEAVERIRPAAELDGIEIVVDEPDHRLAILGDRRQLVSALYNLLDNAVKYSDPGGEVVVRAGSDGSTIDISVQDRGIGIPAKDLERVFERFYRVDQGRSRQTGGTGLGLAIVRHVATNHHGEVRVDSRLGEGSTFTLYVPSASGLVALPALSDAS